MKFITPEMKDRILHFLIEAGVNLDIEYNDAVKELQIEEDFIYIILKQFNTLKLISFDGYSGGAIVRLEAFAYDFYARGGFVGQEELFQKNLDKLEAEIENLKPKFPDAAVKFATILAGLTSYAALFKSK